MVSPRHAPARVYSASLSALSRLRTVFVIPALVRASAASEGTILAVPNQALFQFRYSGGGRRSPAGGAHFSLEGRRFAGPHRGGRRNIICPDRRPVFYFWDAGPHAVACGGGV